MVCVAFERFCAVWLPHHNKVLFTHRKIFFFVLGIIFMSTIISIWFIFVVKMVTKPRQPISSYTSSSTVKNFYMFVYLTFT
jgi:hypothetical protein